MIKSIAGLSVLLLGTVTQVQAATWSDTSLGFRYGTEFAEPFNTKHIAKGIVSLTHASGFEYGSNFFNADMLASDKNDPAGGIAGKQGAQEIYVVYRNTLDIGKVTHQDFKNSFF